ncbi:MAG: RC-LH1 core complex protein PufX [Pseudomonadota bacterium]
MTQSKDHPFLDGGVDKSKLWSFTLRKLAVGAGVGAIVVFGPLLFIYALYLVGTLLPEESKQAQDPSQGEFSSLEQDRVAGTFAPAHGWTADGSWS